MLPQRFHQGGTFKAYDVFLKLTRLDLSSEKCVPPPPLQLGFSIYTTKMAVSLPVEKGKCSWSPKFNASRRQLQSLAKKLQHLPKCIKPASRFTNRVLATLRATPIVGQHAFDPNVLKDRE